MSYVYSLTESFTSRQFKIGSLMLAALVILFYAAAVFAEAPAGFGAHAENINKALPAMTTLVASIAYLGGITFAVIGIIKFKQHRENPQQTTLGLPITLVLVGAGLIFLPTMMKSTGSTITGAEDSAEQGSPEAGGQIWGGSTSSSTTGTTN